MANKEQAKEQQPAVDEQTLSRLVPISGLTKQSVAQLAQKADVLTVKRGQFLFRKGDQDGLTTYILEGELELFADETHVERIQGGSESARHPVAQLQPRQYSARARTECKVIQIQRKLLDQLLALDQSGGYEVSEIEEEDEEDSGDWMSRLLQSELFQKIPTANIQKIFLHVEKLEVEKDAVIVRQGDEGDFYYFIAEGRCAVSRKSEEGREIKLAELRVGDSFGEEALIRETKRNATITMLTDGVLMRLTKDDFAELIRKPLLRTVTYAQGCGMIKLGAQWIDVRLPEEYEQGAIAESINLPLSKLRKEAERLERNRTYIVYCDSGGRSSVAAFLLNQLGFDVSYLGRGLDSCPQAIPKKTAETKVEVTPSAAASSSEQPATAQAEQPEARLPTMLVPASGQSLGEREDQEDAFAVVPLDDQQNAVLLVVADGMGGHAAGEVASKSAVAALCDAVREGFPAESPPDLLRSALQAGNAAIKAKTTERPELQGMGSTLVAVLAIEHRLWWVSVGDSHLYLIRERQLRKLNADHSYGGYLDRMAEAGNAVEPDPRYKRNMLMSALTGEPIPEIDVSDEAFNLQLGDRLLLASDGVNSIGEGALIQHSAWSASSSEYTESLIQAVAEAKKPRQDNTTVAALDVVDREKQGTGVEVKKKQRAADQKVLKLNQQLSDASAKLAAALRQKAEAEAARQSAEQTIAERMKKVESQDDETRKAYEKQLREEQQRREEEIAEANAALDEAQRQRLAAEEARRQAESHAERVRAEEEEMRRRLQEETEERLAAERRKMEEEFARFSKQVEEAERARENAEQKLKDEQARAEQETLKATERMAEAERIRTQAEEARQLDEASQSGSKVRAELEEKLKAEQALLEERLAVAEKVRKDAEAARQQAEDEARKELERLAAEETEQRRKLEEDLKQKEAELEARLASSSTELEEAKRLREEAETARRESEQEAERVRAQSEAEQQRLQQEAEAKLREERQRMEAQFAETVDQLEEAKRMQEEAEAARTAAEDMVRQMRTETDEIEARARAEAEAKIAEERARLEQEFGAARQAVEEAKRIQQEAEEARIAIEEEAAVAQAQAEAAGESIRKELSEKLEKERQELSAKLEAANSQLAEAEAKASEAASAQQEVASEAARIRAAEEQARMQLQAEVEAQLRTERDKFQQELAEAKSRFESAEQAKIEAEARRIAAEQQAANLAEAERKAQESEQQEELTALQAERERMQAEIEKANAELKAAKETLNTASVDNQVAQRRASQLEEAEHEAARLKDQARGAMEQASGEVAELEKELATAREEAAKHAERTREAEEARAEAESAADQAKSQLETARAVAEEFRERERIDREIRGEKKKSPLPLVAGLVVALIAGGGAFFLVGEVAEEKPGDEVTSTETPPPDSAPIVATPTPPPATSTGAPVVAASPPPPPPPPLSTYSDKLSNGTSGPQMVRLPGATFVMGSNSGEDHETPPREVTVPPFSMGIREVSFAEYDLFARATKRDRPSDQWGRGSQPVINVSWEDADAFTKWLSEETGESYRLPTEAEWEYAARGGATGNYWWAEFDDKAYAVCADCDFRNPNPDRPVSVEKMPANPYKLHNAAGNVQEWVQDCYMPTYDGAPSDGSARVWQCPTRVVRGGSYLSRKTEVRPAARSRLVATGVQFDVGFRVARDE
jgi:formylglycine-generating enzyme required for sulfatase activity/serine/threonine protein phosphatase PrpC/CRP-like cAMP-binding protein/rhodanese-related sulfurtransferase